MAQLDADRLTEAMLPGGAIAQRWATQVRAARIAAGDGLGDLAAITGINKSTVSRIETGTGTTGTDANRVLIADAIGCDVAELWDQPGSEELDRYRKDTPRVS